MTSKSRVHQLYEVITVYVLARIPDGGFDRVHRIWRRLVGTLTLGCQNQQIVLERQLALENARHARKVNTSI